MFSYLSTRAMQMARRARKPYIVRPLGQLDAWSLRQSALRKRLYLALIERANLQGAAAVHVTSEAEAMSVRALLPRARVEVIPHGVEARPIIVEAKSRLRTELKLQGDAPVLLFLSRWHKKKNIDVLLNALQSMKSEPWTLVLAGSTDDVELAARVREQVAALGLNDRVVCPGHVRGELKEVLLQGADVFVLPSASENFGIAVAEALVSGTPVLVTSGVDLSVAVRELNGGRVCEPNVGAIAETLRAMLADAVMLSTEQRQRLRAEAEARFSWDANAAALEHLYASVNAHK
jgi:glycosyltransferase involved in cell wall biosynthesis